MTLTYIPGRNDSDGQVVELDNVAQGVGTADDDRGSWADAMKDPAFVDDQRSLLELAADADREVVGD